MKARQNLEDIKQKIMVLEHMCYSSTCPIDAEKLQIDSPEYDPEYEESIRNPYHASLQILNELLEQNTGMPSRSFTMIENFEHDLLSAEFYRSCFFDNGADKIGPAIRKYKKCLEKEISYVTEKIPDDDFAAALRIAGIKAVSRKKFIRDLMAIPTEGHKLTLHTS